MLFTWGAGIAVGMVLAFALDAILVRSSRRVLDQRADRLQVWEDHLRNRESEATAAAVRLCQRESAFAEACRVQQQRLAKRAGAIARERADLDIALSFAASFADSGLACDAAPASVYGQKPGGN